MYIIVRPLAKWAAIVCLCAVLMVSQNCSANDSYSTSAVVVKLTDGSVVKGELLSLDSVNAVVRTWAGSDTTIARSAIDRLEWGMETEPAGNFATFDPNYSRLILMPTARPLHRGAGFATDTWLFFPSISVGVTNNVTMMAGMSMIPFIDLSDQLVYLSPKIGAELTDRLAVSVGTLYIDVPADIDNIALGIAYVVATYGGPARNLTVGLGWGYYKEEHEDFRFGRTPATLLGGYLRTTEVSALLFETWYFPYDEYSISRQPFGLGVRLFGARIAVDACAFATLESLGKGSIPVPWLSASYNFGALR